MSLSRQGQEVQNPQDIVKDPFVLEFVGIPEKQVYLEGELENRLIANLQDFLLELGKGFAFIGRQYKINIGSRHFYVDLVFVRFVYTKTISSLMGGYRAVQAA